MLTTKNKYLKNLEGIKIYVKEYIPTPEISIKKIILFVHGIGIHGGYYSEIAINLSSFGIKVITFDLQGHGHSGAEKGKFISLKSVINDIKLVVENVKSEYCDEKLYILAESMGGTFTYSYLRKYSPNLDGLILIAPAFLIRFRQFLYLNNLKVLFYLIFNRDKPVANLKCGNRIKQSSNDESFKKKRSTDHLSLMKVSANYLLTILKATKRWWKADVNKNLPLLIFHGKKDNIVSPLGSKIFYNSFKGVDKEFKLYKDSYHTLLFDKNTPTLLNDIFAWIKDK